MIQHLKDKPKIKYFYIANPTSGDTFEDAEDFHSLCPPNSANFLAEDIAEQVWDDGGWEYIWPISIQIYDENGTSLGIFKVDQEAVPSFFVISKE